MFKDLREAGWFPWPKILGMRHETDRLMPLLRSSPGRRSTPTGRIQHYPGHGLWTTSHPQESPLGDRLRQAAPFTDMPDVDQKAPPS
jgi:hypothetical protein